MVGDSAQLAGPVAVVGVHRELAQDDLGGTAMIVGIVGVLSNRGSRICFRPVRARSLWTL